VCLFFGLVQLAAGFALAGAKLGTGAKVGASTLRSLATAPRARPRADGNAGWEVYWSGTLFLKVMGAEDIALKAELLLEDGYEPPQGTLRVDECPMFPAGARTRWLLSEDPDDVRDGLWVWGLFKEPLYPFVLMELPLNVECKLPDGSALEPGTYYLQGDHSRDKALGATLTAGKVSRRVGVGIPLIGTNATYMEPIEIGSYVARRER
jgi:hypothetical protein